MYKEVTECCIGNIRLSRSHFTLYPHKVDGSNLQVTGIFSRLLALDENPGGRGGLMQTPLIVLTYLSDNSFFLIIGEKRGNHSWRQHVVDEFKETWKQIQ